MKSKIIIHNEAGIADDEAVALVYSVVCKGKISETGNGKQYCFVCEFKRGQVYASMNKNGTHTFKVRRPWNKRRKRK